MAETAEERLAAMGYSLEKKLTPGAIYQPVVIDGTTAYVSGCLPLDKDNVLTSVGKVPSMVPLEDAKRAAALCAVNILRLLKQELGSLDRVDRMLKVFGMVNSDLDFTEQHLVINGASQLFVDVFGDAGWHARSAVGMAALPRGTSVEVEAVVRIKR